MTKLYNYLIKDGDAIAVGLGAICIIIFALGIYFGSNSGGYVLSELTDAPDKSKINCFNAGLIIMIAMIIISILLMVFGVMWDLLKDFKAGVQTMIGFGVMLAVFLVLYFTSSPDTGGRFAAYWSKEPFFITEGLSKFISAGIYTTGILTAVAVLAMVFYEVRSIFK
ncbi:MAG: hypothetical protein IPO92_09565 [Saprospiraceae bacterium]|nr:hypothetical protein [Saprospiraceae bacterium]